MARSYKTDLHPYVKLGRIWTRLDDGPLVSHRDAASCTRIPIHNMVTAALSALGYAGFGFLARCYALGIQKRNMFESM